MSDYKKNEDNIGRFYTPKGNYDKKDFTKGGYTGDGDNDNYNCQVNRIKNLTLWQRIISIV